MKEKWVFTKMVLTVGFGLLFIVSIGKFCELKTRSSEKKSFVSAIEAKEIKTPFVYKTKRMKVIDYALYCMMFGVCHNLPLLMKLDL